MHVEIEDSAMLSPSPQEVTEYFDTALALMQTYSIKKNEVDWVQIEATARGWINRAQSIREIYPAIRRAIREIGDGHSFLIEPSLRQNLEGNAQALSALSGPMPEGDLVANAIAYVSMGGFVGSDPQRMRSFASAAVSAISTLDLPNTCGWIVDLRQNVGGNVFPMLAGLGPLLGEGELSGSRNAEGETSGFWHRAGAAGIGEFPPQIEIDPYQLQIDDPPIAVLVGPRTASSGEALALAFIGRPFTQTFGLPTAGLTTSNRPIPLADNAILNLASGVMTDRTGRANNGPIVPDVLVESIDNTVATSTDATAEAATKWLQDQSVCRASE
jgi:hypothetical protein